MSLTTEQQNRKDELVAEFMNALSNTDSSASNPSIPSSKAETIFSNEFSNFDPSEADKGMGALVQLIVELIAEGIATDEISS